MMRADPASRRGARSFLFAAVVLALAGRAAVADAAPRVTVVGDDPQTVKALADALRTHKDVEVVDVTSAPVVGDKAAAALAAANGLNAVVAVRVSVDGATWTATVVAYDGRGGTEIGRYDAKSPVVKLSASAAAPVWKKLGAAIQAAQAPEPGAAVAATGTTTGTGAATGTEPGTAVVTEPTTTGTGAGTATEPTTGTGTGTGAATGTGTGTEAGTGTGTGTGAETGSGAGTTTGTAAVTTGAGMVTETGTGGGGGPTVVAPVKPHTAGRGAIRIGAALQPFYRRLRYTDDIRNATRPDSVTVPAVGLEARIRPLAGQPLELTAAVELSVGGSSAADDSSMKYDTRATEWSVGAGYLKKLGPAALGVHVGYGEQTFRIDDDSQPGPEQIPDVDYKWLRAGADIHYAIVSKLHVELEGSYRYLLSTGDLFGDAWFPRGTGNGVDGQAGLRYALKPHLDLFARFDLRHYFFGMNPEVGDPLIVGGAIDTFLGGSLGASWSAF